ncbi:MAG TPA: amidase family protein [Vicinamibacterales bacterium]|nr:amidase family protein [Vicinamibacterales bacterium]
MSTLKRAVVAVLLIAALTPLSAQRTIDLDAATIADVNAAFAKGTLTSERLTQMFLARIDAYDRKGPALRAVLTINPKALEVARAMDAERRTKGPRSPLHGIPIVLKDNIDTADLPTTGGSVMLEGSIPPDDAFVVQKLRAAGAVIVAKANLSEFASGAAHSSLGGQILNPHDLTRTPSGSSGGTGASIAAAFAMAGLGTDTGGSVRGPSTANGIAGLKTTMGLVSRDGVIPLALSFDTVGPMARSVHDVAVMLSVIAGVDPADASTKAGAGRSVADYTQSLKVDALKGARLGIARDFVGQDTDVDWIIDASVETMRKQGATIVDVRLPKWLLDAKGEYYNAIRYPEFVVQIADYLKTLGPKYPKNITELIDRARQLNAPSAAGASPNPQRWSLMVRESTSGTLNDYQYTSVRDHGLPLVRAILDGILKANNIDAIVYPTASRRTPRLDAPPDPPGGAASSGSNLANLSGFPELIVPAGFSTEDLPIGISFLGPAFSESRLLAIGYAFEQATKARRLPITTPLRPGDSIAVP